MSAPGNIRRRNGASDDYETPPEFWYIVDSEFAFTVDGAANEDNHKCAGWVGLDGFHDSYGRRHEDFDPAGARIFLNPPYGHGLGKWVGQCQQWMDEGARLVVALLPNGTDTLWYGEVERTAAEIRFVFPRIQFIHPPGCGCMACESGKPSGNAGGNMLAIWRKPCPERATAWWWQWK